MKIKRLITKNTHTIEIKMEELIGKVTEFYNTKIKHLQSDTPLKWCYYKIVKEDGSHVIHPYGVRYEEIVQNVKCDWMRLR